MHDNDNPRLRQLGGVLYMLSVVLGMAELGIMSRAGEWLAYEQIGTLGFVYFLALLGGVLIAPVLPLRPRNVIALSVLLAAVPIVGIGLLLARVFPTASLFDTVTVLWVISGAGAGMLDNAFSAQAVNYQTGKRTNSVAMLGMRHLGTLMASGISAVAVTVGFAIGWHYAVLGAILIVPVLGRRYVPDLPHREASETARAGRTRSAWILVPMGVFLAAAVLPISVSWAYITPIMRELGSSGTLGGTALSAFVVAQAVACYAYFIRSRKHDVGRLVGGGLVIAVLGVVALGLVVAHAQFEMLPDGWVTPLAFGGFVLLGWGVAPLPMVVAEAVNRLPLKMRITSALSLMVALQCLLVAGANLVFGRLAEQWTATYAFAAMGAVCVALLFVGLSLTRRRSKPFRA